MYPPTVKGDYPLINNRHLSVIATHICNISLEAFLPVSYDPKNAEENFKWSLPDLCRERPHSTFNALRVLT